jgi:hypothetical protein
MLERLGEFTVGTHIVIRHHGQREGLKTNLYGVWPKDDDRHEHPLGNITWFGRWRKYTFNPLPNTTYEETCLREIAQFIEEETKAHKAKQKNDKAAAKS